MTAYESITAEIPTSEFGACALIQDLLPLYLEGEVSPGSRDTIVEHLARCERCASYLAGAQSVRAQLNRDRVQRINVFMGDQPARQSVAFGRRLATMIATLALCGLGAVASLLVAIGLGDSPSPAPLPIGMILGSISFAGLAALAQRNGPFALARLGPVFALCGLGALAAVLLVLAHQPGLKLLGIILAAVAVAGVWMMIVPERREAA